MSDQAIWRDVKERLAERAPEFVQWLYPCAEKCSAHEVAVGSLEGDPGSSLKICISGSKAGVWKDFSGADSGANLLELLIKAKGCKAGEGLKMAANWLGMTLPEPAKKEKDGGRRRFVCAYDYRTPEGALVHQTIRFHLIDEHGQPVINTKTGSPEKTFFQRRPAQKGMREGNLEAKCDKHTGEWWIWTLAGIEPVLYNLPELAARPHEEVWIVEGEKDADALLYAGMLSTTCPMGAGKWRDSYTQALKGRRVVLCGDSDEAGRAGMKTIGKKLEPVCELVEAIEWSAVLARVEMSARAQEKWDGAKLAKELAA